MSLLHLSLVVGLRVSAAILGPLVFLLGTSFDADSDEWNSRCLEASMFDQSFPFDNSRVIFSGRPNGGKILYCLVIPNAQHEYFVLWEDAQMFGWQTQNGVSASEVIVSTPQDKETIATVGANGTRYKVKVPVGTDTKLGYFPAGIEWNAITKVYGALPTNDDSGRFQSVNMEFTSGRSAGGECFFGKKNIQAVDQKQTINFRFPDVMAAGALKSNLGEKLFDLTAGEQYFSYEYERRDPQPISTVLYITNRDGKELARVPLVACGLPQ